jgi:hypothetical protein
LFLTKLTLSTTYDSINSFTPCIYYRILEGSTRLLNITGPTPDDSSTYIDPNNPNPMCTATNATNYYTVGCLLPVRDLTQINFKIILSWGNSRVSVVLKQDSRLMVMKMISDPFTLDTQPHIATPIVSSPQLS